jgi:Mrp family chromosome partitioning ATPase
MGKSVLLIDADRRDKSQYEFFHVRTDYDWRSILSEGGMQPERAFQQVGTSSLFLSRMCSDEYPGGKIFTLPDFRDFWDRLRDRFELILFDSAPLTSCADALAISKHVDGVILVLEADKTRVPAAESIRDRLRESGANVLGTIFNKRRYYIPEAIYKRL